MHSFRAIKLLLIYWACLMSCLSWNWVSAVFSEPARSMMKSSPSSMDGICVFLTLILQTAWDLEEVSFLKVAQVFLFFAAVVSRAPNLSARILFSHQFCSGTRGEATRNSLSLSRPNRTNERTRKREKERILSLTSSSLASRIFLLSSSDPETRKHLLFFFFLSTHRFKGLSRGGGRCRRW